MGNRRTVWLAWALCALTICVAVVLYAAEMLGQTGVTNRFQFVADALFSLAMPVVCALMAALIVSRQPHNTIGWLLLVPMGSFLVNGPITAYLQRLAPSSPAPTLRLLLLVWFSGWSWLLLIFPLLHILLLFPTGQPPTPRWRWVSRATILWAVLFVLLATFSQSIHANTKPDLVLDSPIGALDDDAVQSLVTLWVGGLLVLVVLCVAALVVRYRRANDIERQQIKWLLAAGALFLVVYVVDSVGGLSDSTSLVAYFWQVCFGLSVVSIPAAIGIAILRYRLFEIDVIINRTLVYGMLTAVLGLTYFGSVVLLQQLFRAVIGQQSQLAVVASTLAIAALFQPLRRRIQALIDRRFYRRKYDA